MKTGTQSDVAFVCVSVRVACPTRRDVLLAESIQYRGTPLHSAVPKKFFCGTSKRRGPRPLESNTSSIFSSPNNRGGTEQSCDIYIYIYRVAWKEFICRNLAGHSRQRFQFYRSGYVTNFLENFLGFSGTRRCKSFSLMEI